MYNGTEEEIMKNWEGNINTPLVSICTITYNHEKYIAEALNSFLMQKTNFSFEILINEDCSLDSTANVIKKYMEKFPRIINANLRDQNAGLLLNITECMKRAEGKYLAICDGDDYWIDPLKLQKQVGFLEFNKEYNMVFHNAELLHHTGNGVTTKPFNLERKSRDYTADEILETWSIPTSSVLCRNESQYRYLEDNLWFPVEDTPYHIKCASLGKLYYMAETMSVYRMLPSGMINSEEFKSLEHNISFIKYLDQLQNDFSDIISDKITYPESARHCIGAAEKSKKNGCIEDYWKYLILGMTQDPEPAIKYINRPKDKTIKSLQENLKSKDETIKSIQENLKQTNNHLDMISNTIHRLVTTSGKKEPLKKYKAYKEMLNTHHKVKNKK